MSATLDGTDYSWLAVDARNAVGWFTVNGSGFVPDLLRDDPDQMKLHEIRLGHWVRSLGKPFRFGAGYSMWDDVAACGVYPFDFEESAQKYLPVAQPPVLVLVDELPFEVREVLVVRLPTARFAEGAVSIGDVSAVLRL